MVQKTDGWVSDHFWNLGTICIQDTKIQQQYTKRGSNTNELEELPLRNEHIPILNRTHEQSNGSDSIDSAKKREGSGIIGFLIPRQTSIHVFGSTQETSQTSNNESEKAEDKG